MNRARVLFSEQRRVAIEALKWCLIAAPVSFAIGSLCAFFLWSLERVTQARFAHPWLVYCLPLAGLIITFVYRVVGRSAERGNNLIINEIHEPGAGVPARMAPLVLAATLLTHLVGGSAGREGTAVQMGGSVAAQVSRLLRLDPASLRTLLMVGIAAGFGGVFGTPVAGAIFALEVLVIGNLRHAALFPCLVAGLVGDWGCAVWGVHHTAYHIALVGNGLSWLLIAEIAAASIAFGLASILFVQLTHALHRAWDRHVPREWLRPVIGGGLLIALCSALQTRDYLGIGVVPPPGGHVSIVTAFEPGGATPLSWWWKTLFTALTLSCGFKGGEVTPLFFIGATLGNVLAAQLNAPTDLFAALGFVAVFAGATNTPIACTLMGIELFGTGQTVPIAIACTVAWLFSGSGGIYSAQRSAA